VPEDAELGLDQRDVMVKLVNMHGDFHGFLWDKYGKYDTLMG
jgi:hypothetical protein